MALVGKTDSFERLYMEKFRVFAAAFGEFVNYEHDRAARDIGLHLTQQLASGQERVSSSLCWFQMKGVMDGLSAISIRLQVSHLKFWFLQPMPTYLVVYVECVDKFLILNIQDYVNDTWGRDILTLKQKRATVHVPVRSELDDQAFRLILEKGDIEEWKRAIEADESEIKLCRRDCDLIWHLGTAADRNAHHRVIFWDWQSKMRSQLFVQERLDEDGWTDLREHWQYRMSVHDLEPTYAYVEFFSLEDEDSDDSWFGFEDDYDEEVPPVSLANGDVVRGENAAYEYFEYQFGMRLNPVGQQLYYWVQTLQNIGLLEVTPGKSELVSVAPWHHRSV